MDSHVERDVVVGCFKSDKDIAPVRAFYRNIVLVAETDFKATYEDRQVSLGGCRQFHHVIGFDAALVPQYEFCVYPV